MTIRSLMRNLPCWTCRPPRLPRGLATTSADRVVRGLTGLRMSPSAQAGSVVVHEGAAGPLAVRRHDHLPLPVRPAHHRTGLPGGDHAGAGLLAPGRGLGAA